MRKVILLLEPVCSFAEELFLLPLGVSTSAAYSLPEKRGREVLLSHCHYSFNSYLSSSTGQALKSSHKNIHKNTIRVKGQDEAMIQLTTAAPAPTLSVTQPVPPG